MPKNFTRGSAKAAEPAAILPEGELASVPMDAKKETPKSKQTGKKFTLRLSKELDFRLENLASFRGQHKAAFALYLLEVGCRGYNADKNLRSVFAEISGQSREVA